MQCPRCGAENRATNAFCGACGTALGLICKSCGHPNPQESRFCGQCSSPLPAAAAALQSAHDILRSLSAIGGERKWLTVLFADICGSTRLIESVDLEQGMQRLKPALDAMKDAVHRYEGVVNKLQGDGIMALFGAPRPQEDHAVRACLAALSMQDATARLDDPALQIRVGLHTGEVVVQATESDLSQSYDAAGAAVHLARRMEEMADSRQTLLTAGTFHGAQQFVEGRSLGQRPVRGISGSVEVFQLIGLRHAPASERFRSGPKLSPLSGRARELAALEEELVSTVRGEAHVVGIVGEAGLGKSRLCFEFVEACRRQEIRVLEARVLAHGRTTPFQLVLDLLRAAFGIRPQEAADVSRHRIKEVLRSRGEFGEILPVLLEFLGVPDPADPAPRLDPSTRKSRLLDFVRQFIHARPHDEITVALVEDLHWADPASEEFVEALVDAIVGTKTLLLVNFRPGLAAPWMQRAHYRQLNLAPLGAAEVSQLLHDLLGDDPSLALLRRNIAERAQGNPFFLEELVGVLIERGDFEGAQGAYRLRGGIDAIPLPGTVQAVLSARIDRLEELSKQVLQTAAVIGREVPFAVLERVAGLPATDLAKALWRLRRVELLFELPPYEHAVHAFRHPLIQEVAYRSLLHERCRQLHGAVARALEAVFKDQADEHAGLVAHHLEQAGEALPAAQANVRAAIWVGANDPSQALRSWRKVHELLIAQPSPHPADYLRMMACGQIVNFGWREGLTAADVKSYFEEAKRLALAGGDMRANALIHAGYGRILAASGSADEYVEKIREAQALIDESKEPGLTVTLRAVLCHALRLSGRMADALTVNIEAMNRAHEIDQFGQQMLGFDIELWLIAMRGQTLVMLGRGDEARTYLDRVIQFDPARIDATNHTIPSLAYVDLAWATRDQQLAEEHAGRAFALAVKSGSPYLRVYAQACRGVAHVIGKRFDAAIADLAEALDFARRRKAGLENEARILADLANVQRLNGDLRSALVTAAEAIKVATARHARVSECFARTVHAEALAAANVGGLAASTDELDRAEILLAETGAHIYAPFIHAARSNLSELADAPRKSAQTS